VIHVLEIIIGKLAIINFIILKAVSMQITILNYSMKLKKKPFKLFVSTMLVALWGSVALATTIIPFPNLGEMAKASDAVVVARATSNFEVRSGTVTRFRTSFTVVETIKGTLAKDANFELQAWKMKDGDFQRIIWGDPEYVEGSVYLLFLSQRSVEPFWQPQMLSYGIFEREAIDGESYFVPSKESLGLEVKARPDGIVPEPMAVYATKPLINKLREIVNEGEEWDKSDVIASDEINDRVYLEKAPPAHCTYINIGGNNARYTGFPADDIILNSEDDGDSSFTPPSAVHVQVSNAVSDLETSYGGIDYNYSGTKNYVPTCEGGSAGEGNFLSVVGVREGLVIFNDPCDEIDDLVGCSGTLAVGGLYASGTHDYDGLTWASGYNTYVIVNDSIGPNFCISANDYKIMLIHELSHGLGIGHIASGAGAANMNPSCCNTIQPLDVQCLDYTYAPLLPVELIDFTAQKESLSVALQWQTASEKNNDHFLLQRSVEGRAFETVGKIPGAGNSQNLKDYHFIDQEPGDGLNYYRLKQVDFDGHFEYSEVRSVRFDFVGEQISVYPNPLDGELINVRFSSPAEWEFDVELMDVNGTLLAQQKQFLEKGVNKLQFSLSAHPSGVYWLRFNYGPNTHTERIVKL
jgi:hypothetical protein